MSYPTRPRVFDPWSGEYERLRVTRLNNEGWHVVRLGMRQIGAVRPDRTDSHGKAGWTAHSSLPAHETQGLQVVQGFRSQADAMIYLIRVIRGAYTENEVHQHG